MGRLLRAGTPIADTRREPSSLPRVCLLAESFDPVHGGAETHAWILARELNRLGSPTFVLTRLPDRTPLRRESPDGFEIIRYGPAGIGRFARFAGVATAYRELLRHGERYDVIYVCGFKALGAPAVHAARRMGKVCVLRAETYGEMSGAYASAYRPLSRPEQCVLRILLALRNRAMRGADAFVSISEQIHDELLAHGAPPDRVTPISNGVDTSQFYPLGIGERLDMRRSLGLPVDRPIAIYSGRIIKGKGVDHLIQAWVDVIRAYPEAFLVVLGTGAGEVGDIEDEVKSFAAEHGLSESVAFPGWSNVTNRYLQAADIYVLASDHEGLPLSMIEAMACELPVVVTSVGGIPEMVRNGENGVLIENPAPALIADAVRGLLGDPARARELGRAARATAEDHSIVSVATRHNELFVRLLAESRASTGRPR